MGQTTFYSRRYQCWPPVANRDIADGNSYHWEQQAQLNQRRLSELLGPEDYRLWAEMTWPRDAINDQSWKQIHDTCQWALDHPEATDQTLECACPPVGSVACPVCKAHDRIRARDEYQSA